jgi:hypothetical protein
MSGVTADADGSNVPVGTQWVTQTVVTTLNAAITAAQGVSDNTDATQAQIDAAITVAFDDQGNGLVSQSPFTLSPTEPKTIVLANTVGPGETVQWLVDGVVKSTDPSSFTLDGSTLGEGGHTLTVQLMKGAVPWSTHYRTNRAYLVSITLPETLTRYMSCGTRFP